MGRATARRLAALAVSAGVLLAGCSTTRGGAEGPTPEQGGTITIASWLWLEKGRGEQLQQALDGYSARHPGVQIEPQAVTRAEFEKTMSTQIGGGRGPDLLVLPDTFFPELAEAGALEPLDGVLDRATEDTLLAANDGFRHEGRRLALLWEQSPYGLFWNTELLARAGVAPPRTAEELLAAAEAVHERTGAIGFAGRHQMNEESIWWSDFSNWPYGFGGEWSDGERLTIDTPANIAAVTAFKRMYDSPAFSRGDDASTYRSKFAAGEVGIMIDCAPCMRTILRGNDRLSSADIGGSTLPLPTDRSVYVGVGIGINPHSQHKALARDFLRWLYSTEGQGALQEVNFPSTVGTDLPPPRRLLEENPWVVPVRDALPDARQSLVAGFGSGTPQIRRIVLSHVERVLTRDVDPAAALGAAQREAEEALG